MVKTKILKIIINLKLINKWKIIIKYKKEKKLNFKRL